VTDPEAAELIRALARLIAHEVVEMLRDDEVGWVDQHGSPLGPRRHVAAIRSGALRGKQLGRLWVARKEDVEAYVAGAPAQPKLGELEELERRLLKRAG
jgi:hypothetical protein